MFADDNARGVQGQNTESSNLLTIPAQARRAGNSKSMAVELGAGKVNTIDAHSKVNIIAGHNACGT